MRIKKDFLLNSIPMLLALAFAHEAQAFVWNDANHGFQIQTTTSNGVSQIPGQSAPLTGQVQFVTAGVKDPTPIAQLMQTDDVQLKFYFPDLTNEVTSQVTTQTNTANNSIAFSYATPALVSTNLNTLIVQVVHYTADFQNLENEQSKVQERVFLLNQKIQSLQGNPAKAKEVATLTKTLTQLQSLEGRIAQKIINAQQLGAEQVYPLQVGNVVAQAGFNLEIMSNFLLQVSYDLGSAIQGESTVAHATATRLSAPSGDTTQWKTDFVWQNETVNSVGPAAFPANTPLEFDYQTGSLSPSDMNAFGITVTKWNTTKNKPADSIASLSLALPVAADAVQPQWLAGYSPNLPYVQNAQPIAVSVQAQLGLIDPKSIQVGITGQYFTGGTINSNVTSSLSIATPDQGQTYNISGNLNVIPEGVYTMTLNASNLAGVAASPLVIPFSVVRTPPTLSLGQADNQMTNNLAFALPVNVLSQIPVTTTVLLNGLQADQENGAAFTSNLSLNEGINTINVTSTDAAGNSSSAQLSDIDLNNIPPVLSNVIPAANGVVGSLNVAVTGQSNTALASVSVNGLNVPLSPDQKSFAGYVAFTTVGTYTLKLVATDMFSNVTNDQIPIQVVIHILNGNLISVSPAADGKHLVVNGAAGTVRAGDSVTVATGFFNSTNVTANVDGSFTVTTGIFATASVTATDSSIGVTESTNISYGAASGTVLSGLVKDTSGNALAGATLSLASSGQSVVTDASGSYTFSQPVTGDQTLLVDGTTITPNINAPEETFSKVTLSLNIGLNQSNVMQRPIYLAPILMDGTSTVVDASAGGVVTHPNAPGVSLSIPAGSANFPGGATQSPITLSTVSAQFSTVPPLPSSIPKNVVTLEPSGTTFSQPVDLTLPNDNNLPAGVEVVIMSMNSQKGIWEIGGAAKVSSDGTQIVTKPGQGLLHFSEVYASIPGPSITQTGAQDQAGADTFNGALTTSVSLPSYKSLGNSVTPKLMYKSSWATPGIMITDLFSIDPQTQNVTPQVSFQDGTTSYQTESQHCDFLMIGCSKNISTIYAQYEQVNTFIGQSYIQPDFITAQFSGPAGISSIFTLQGPTYQSVISYLMNAADASGNYVASGVYAYAAHYEVHLKSLIVGTVTSVFASADPNVAPQLPQTTTQAYQSATTLAQTFPSDMQGTVFVDNETKSPMGRGWKIGGVQKIANPQGSVAMIEEGDGSISSYSISNTIDTLMDGATNGVNFSQGVSLNNWPNLTAYGSNNQLSLFNFSNLPPIMSQEGNFPTYTANSYEFYSHCLGSVIRGHCSQYTTVCMAFSTSSPPSLAQAYTLPDGRTFGIDRNNIYQLSNGTYSLVTGQVGGPPLAGYSYGGYGPGYSLTPTITGSCDPNNPPAPNGTTPSLAGFQDGPVANAQFNSPLGISAGFQPNTLVVADTGNNVVRLIDLNANKVSTIAGTQQNNCSSAGPAPALSTCMYHPRAVVYDSLGNLYVSTELGNIIEIDQTGVANFIVGGPNAVANLLDNVVGTSTLLNLPTGLAVDNTNHILYVAETGLNRVRRLDLTTLIISTSAGSVTSGFSGDGGPAVNAQLSAPLYVGLDLQNNLLVADSGNNKFRRVTFQATSTGTLSYAPSANDNSSLIRNSDGTWTRTYRNGTQNYFDTSGNQVASIDRVGRQNSFNYDGYGRLIQTQDPVGQVVNYAYSGSNLSSVTDPAGRVTRLSYNSSGNLTGVNFPDGSTKSYYYNQAGLMTAETDQEGNTTQYAYNQYNRLTNVTQADSSVISVNDSASATAVNNYTGGTVGTMQQHGSSQGQAAEGISNASSETTVLAKDFQGYINTVTDASGNVTVIKRNLGGNPIEIDRPSGQVLTYTYDPNTSDLLSQTDSATGITKTQAFDQYGNLVSQTGGKGFTSSNVFDPVSGLLISKTDGNGNSNHYSYSGLGLMVAATNALGKTLVSNYDNWGRLISTVDPLGKTVQYSYDGAGNLLSMKDPLGRITTYTYDLMNHLKTVTTPKNETTQYTYFSSGNLAQVIDAKGNVNSYQYDVLGRLISKTDPLGYSTTRQYDSNGNLIQEVDPNGNIKNFAYNNLNKVVQKQLPDNTYSYTYNINNQMTAAANKQSQVNFGYDTGLRLVSTSITGAGVNSNLSYTWDLDNNRMSVSDPTGTTQYSYDQGDRLTGLKNTAGEVFNFGFDTANRINTVNRPGSQTVIGFDDSNLVNSMIHTANGSPLISFGLNRDLAGNITNQSYSGNISFSKAIGYDGDNQITSSINPEAPANMRSESFNYDNIFNRTTDQGGSFVYDSKSLRLVQDYRYFYFYDKNGNMTSKQAIGLTGEVTNFSYSSENQLIAIQYFMPGNTTAFKVINYTYDAVGRRIQKQVVDNTAPNDPTKTFTRNYVYDNQEILLEYDGSNTLLARYTHSSLGTDDVLSVFVTNQGTNEKLAQNPGSYFYLKDPQGSITDIADSSGNRLQHYVYSAYGELLGIQDAMANDISANPVLATSYAFVGREHDFESGLSYNRARYYDPCIGRFLQKDPQPGILSLPSSIVNSYIYAANNPLGLKDPSGQDFWSDFFGGIGDLFTGIITFAASVVVAAVGLIVDVATGGKDTDILQAGLTGIEAGAKEIAGGALEVIFAGTPWHSYAAAIWNDGWSDKEAAEKQFSGGFPGSDLSQYSSQQLYDAGYYGGKDQLIYANTGASSDCQQNLASYIHNYFYTGSTGNLDWPVPANCPIANFNESSTPQQIASQ